jgi:acetyltransferase-like isoleucine patch superfamily enzyme
MMRILGEARDAPWKARNHARRLFCQPWFSLRLRLSGVETGKRVRLFGAPRIQRHRRSSIRIGAGSELRSWRSSNVLGLSKPVILATMQAGAVIEIGENVGMSGTVVASAIRIAIGRGTTLGADVLITDSDHHFLGSQAAALLGGPHTSASPIDIGAHVFVGTGAIILKGSRIGDGAIIGAGAVITGQVEEGAVVAGNPYRRIGRSN